MFLLLDFNTQWCHILLSSDALLKFLNPTPGPSTTSTAAASTSAAQPTSDAASAAQPSHDAAASSGLPVASTSAAQPTSFAAASSGVPVASTSAAQQVWSTPQFPQLTKRRAATAVPNTEYCSDP